MSEREPRTLPLWTGPKLEYLNPVQVVEHVGYRLLQDEYTDEERRHFQACVDRVPDQDGEPAERTEPFSDPESAAAAIKELATELGAAQVGVTPVDQFYVYEGQDVPHRNAVVMAFTMDYERIAEAPGPATNAEVLGTYDEAGAVGVEVARFIRGRGYPARAHGFRFEQLAMIPHARAAGLGELGKHGSLINRELGCSFRLSVVTTDLPLATDAPRDEGIEDFCSSCNMCVKYCPGDAISHEKQEVRGSLRWIVETERCAPYWGTYSACALCLTVCPMNAGAHEGRWKRTFIDTIKSTDREQMRAELEAGVQERWSLVPRPAGS